MKLQRPIPVNLKTFRECQNELTHYILPLMKPYYKNKFPKGVANCTEMQQKKLEKFLYFTKYPFQNIFKE